MFHRIRFKRCGTWLSFVEYRLMAIWAETGRGNACRMATERKRVAAMRTTQPKPAIEPLYGKTTGDERSATQRGREEEHGLALKPKLSADPVRSVENDCKQRNGNAEESDSEHHGQTFRLRFEGIGCHGACESA